jgi:protein ImuA
MDALPPAVLQPDPFAAAARAGGMAGPRTPARRTPPMAPEALHPALWLGHQLGRQVDNAVATGFPLLDAQLPGGGWPCRALSELLLPHTGIGEIRLLSPCLAATQQAGRLVMVFDPPENLSGWALAQLGLDVEQLLVVNTRARAGAAPRPPSTAAGPPARRGPALRESSEQAWERPGARPAIPGADSLWALEQALKSGHVGAVLAWLPPRLRAERLRRLQLAAQAHDGAAFVMRELAAAQRPTAAPLRIALRPAGADKLALRLLKRRGPPLTRPLQLALPPVLSELARGRVAAAAAEIAQQACELHAATFIDLA